MKKLLTALLAMAMLLSCVCILSACAPKPELDLEDAKEALEDEGYTVIYIDDTDELDVAEREYLNAYDEDYKNYLTVIKFKDESSARLYYKHLKAEKDIEIEYYKHSIKFSEYALENYEDDMNNEEIDQLEDSIKKYKKDLETSKKKYVIGRNGKYVWYGTKNAIEDSRG